MKFDSTLPRRRSLRLPGYDYSQAGGYFVTIVTQYRKCLFGEICNDEMIQNEAGKMVVEWWNQLPQKFPSMITDIFVVMPNHFHGVIFIHETVGDDLCVVPGEHTGSPLHGTRRPYAPLPQIIQWFKTMTTNNYIRGVKQSGWPPFEGKLWQRNYYEHILRDQKDYERVADYIAINPAKWNTDEVNSSSARP